MLLAIVHTTILQLILMSVLKDLMTKDSMLCAQKVNP